MMEDWTDIIGEELGNISEPLPADDWNVLQQKYAAARRRRKAAVFAWIGGLTSAAAAAALALLLIRPSEPSVLERDMVAEAEVLEEVPVAVPVPVPVSVPVQNDSVVVDESRSNVLTPVTRPSAAKSHTETEDVLLADADSEGMIQVVKDTADVTEVLVAEALPEEVSDVPEEHADQLEQNGQTEQDEHADQDALSALEGQVAGVSIRGASSVRGGDGPVYVVDGFVVSASEASAIDPEDLAAAREALGLKPEPEELKKRGRPPGRKSGKAQEKEPQTAMNTKSESSVLKKSDSVLEKIALAAAQAAMSAMKEPSAPRKRGRPRKIAEQS